MDQHALRNFRDFLQMYNVISETCFLKCVFTLGEITLHRDEVSCVEKCAQKQININHRMMEVFMEVQPKIVAKKIDEFKKTNEAKANQDAAS